MRRVAAIALLFGWTSAVADELPETVVTATRIPTLAEQIPAGVTVIDRQTIEERGYVTLVQALSAVPGLYVVQSGGPGGNASVFIRGTNSNQVLVLRDGVPVNDASTPNGAYNFGVDTLADIERIEVIRGPMSGLYGSGPIGGVINLISRQGEGSLHAEGELAGGTQKTILGDATVAGTSGPIDYSATVESTSTSGFDVTPKRETGVYTGETDGDRVALAAVNLGWMPVAGTRIGLILRGLASVFGLDNVGASPSTDFPNYTGRDSNLFGRLSADSTLFDGMLHTTLLVAREQDDRSYIQLLTPGDPNMATNDDHYHGYRTDVQWNNTAKLPDWTAFSASTVTFGYEYIGDTANTRANDSSFGSPFVQSVNAAAASNAGYGGVQTTLWRQFVVTGAVRGQDNGSVGSAVTWRLGGVLAVPELLSHIKIGGGTSFLAPSLFDRFGVGSFGFVGNPNLKPEYGSGWEAGWTVDLPLGERPDAVSLSATYFQNNIKNLIVTVFSPVFTEQNIGRAHTDGVEFEATFRPANWLEATIDYTYTSARDAETTEELLRRPYDALAFTARITPLPRLTFVPQVTAISGFHDFLINDQGFGTGIGVAKGGAVLNVSANYQLTEQVALYATGYNLTGATFEVANGFAQPGTSVLVGTRVKF
jgi:vitamin B12 transporter